MNEEQKENDNLINNFKSLAPNDNADDIDIYKPYIDKILKDSNNKNIAISGRYGAGKSSIIKTYFKDKKVIYVSLASYIEKNQSEEIFNNGKNLTEKNKMKRIIVDQIETSILQQILYKERPHKLPYSRINRIDKESYYVKPINFIISFILTLFFCLSFIIINYNDIKRITDNIPKKVILCLTLSSMFIIILLLVNYISKLGIKKVSINGVELSKEESDISILNRNIDELIHFFMRTNYKYVVFEDIDRLSNCTLIFSKLKEINSILNNALENENKQVVFIYAVVDTVFSTAEERTKFFDAIIPIVPYSTKLSSKKIFLKDKYKKFGFDKDIVISISRYIDNPRLVYDIINEYTVYKDINEKSYKDVNLDGKIQIDPNEILILCTYKILHPDRFELLQKQSGKISYYLSPQFYKDYYQPKFEEINKEIENIKKITDKNISLNSNIQDVLKRLLFINGINVNTNKINRNYSNSNYIENYIICDAKSKKEIGNLQDFIVNPLKYKEVIEKDNIYIKNEKEFEEIDYTGNNFFYPLTLKEAFKMNLYDLNNPSSKVNEYIKDYENISKENILNQQREKIIEYLTDKDLSENKNFVTQEKYKKLEPYEEWMIIANKIDRNYKRIIVRNQDTKENLETEEILNYIVKNKSLDGTDLKIKNVKALINELTILDFRNDSICIKEIFDYIINNLESSEEQEKYLNNFFQNLSIKKINFIVDYVIEQENIKKFPLQIYINKIISFCNNQEIYEQIKNQNSIIEKIYCLEVYYFSYINIIDKLQIKHFFENVANVEKIFIDNLMLLSENLPKLDIEFKQKNFSQDEIYKPFYEYVYREKMYKLNFDLMEVLDAKHYINFKKEHIITSIIKNNIYNLYGDNFTENDARILLINVDLYAKSQEDDEVTLREFVEKYNLYTEEEHLFSLIKKERIKFKDISWINSTLYDDLLKNNQVYANWNNIYLLYESDYTSNPEMLNRFVKDNIVSLSKQKIASEYFDMINIFIQNKTIENYRLNIIDMKLENISKDTNLNS